MIISVYPDSLPVIPPEVFPVFGKLYVFLGSSHNRVGWKG